MPSNLEHLLQETSQNGRICPQPKVWNELWKLLPDREQANGKWTPALPLILAAWSETDDGEKRKRFEEHLRYADEHGALQVVSEYLHALHERDWHHINLSAGE